MPAWVSIRAPVAGMFSPQLRQIGHMACAAETGSLKGLPEISWIDYPVSTGCLGQPGRDYIRGQLHPLSTKRMMTL